MLELTSLPNLTSSEITRPSARKGHAGGIRNGEGIEKYYNITILPECLKRKKLSLRKINRTSYWNIKRDGLFLTLVKCVSGFLKNEGKNKQARWRAKKQLNQEESDPIKLCNLAVNFVCQLIA